MNSLFNSINTPEELLDFMEKNIHYGFITKDNEVYTDPTSDKWSDSWYKRGIVQTGDNVLKTLYGTCWDQVELERKWFDEHNYNSKSYFFYFDLDYENSTSTHTVLIYENNNKYYLFENAWDGVEGITEFDSYNDAVKCVKDRLFEYNLEINPEYNLKYSDLLVYEYDKLDTNMTVQDYLNYVVNEEKEVKINK